VDRRNWYKLLIDEEFRVIEALLSTSYLTDVLSDEKNVMASYEGYS